MIYDNDLYCISTLNKDIKKNAQFMMQLKLTYHRQDQPGYPQIP